MSEDREPTLGVPSLFFCRGLTVRFGGLVALNRLDIDIHRGETIGLLGPNGSGKTTFFNVVTRVYGAAQGSIVFDGEEITRLSGARIFGRGIARTFQRSRLCLELSIFDNVALGMLAGLDLSLRTNLLGRKGLHADQRRRFADVKELLSIFNPSLAENVDAEAGACSMIDRRRIEICRALIGRPKLLLLDEPSAGMTPDETEALMRDISIVRARMPGLAVVLIEHEMGIIEKITDRCIVLNYGEKIFEGSFREVVEDRRVQEAYLGGA